MTPQHFSLLSKLLDRHLPRLMSFIDELMTYADKAEQRRGTRSGIIFDEDVLDEARGIAIRSYSVDSVKAMLRELEKTQKEFIDAVNVQNDISQKYIELQMQHQELMKKYAVLEKKTTEYEQGVKEMQNKLNELKFKLKI
jgi:septal ring factor EnvC (AmiA/AmiB activator)